MRSSKLVSIPYNAHNIGLPLRPTTAKYLVGRMHFGGGAGGGRDVDLDRGELTIRAEKAKDGDTRVLPISSRLKAVLQMAKTDPTGNDHPADKFVFGEFGEQTKNISRAWRTCVLKAYGHEPEWTAPARLLPASLATLRGTDLRSHDLRHEGASRFWRPAGSFTMCRKYSATAASIRRVPI